MVRQEQLTAVQQSVLASWVMETVTKIKTVLEILSVEKIIVGTLTGRLVFPMIVA